MVCLPLLASKALLFQFHKNQSNKAVSFSVVTAAEVFLILKLCNQQQGVEAKKHLSHNTVNTLALICLPTAQHLTAS